MGRLALAELTLGPLVVEKLELEIADLGTAPGAAVAERFQRRRTRLRALAVRISGAAIDERVAQVRRQLAGVGITQLSARVGDGFVSVRARAADGLAAADVSFRIQLVHAGAQLRALASAIRVHGHLPTPGPVLADRIQTALLGATETPGAIDRPRVRGLCDLEVDLIGAVLWHLMPPNGWRLPAVADLELVGVRIGRGAIEIAFGPAGTRTGELGVRPAAHQLAGAHDLMHSVDQLVRDGHLEDGMRGYRALLAAGGPDQPQLLERILALAAARPAWFFDGLELARQALGRWPVFPPAHAALASITLAQGDAREAAGHLAQVARLASADGDDDQAALAALAGARLLRVLEPREATELYQLALEHDPGSTEAADSLADRLADEQRWPELVRLIRARAATTTEPARAVQLRLRLADVFVHRLDDAAGAQDELAAARALAPDDPAVHEMTAAVLGASDPDAARAAWREVGRLAEARGDHRTAARAWAALGDLLAREPGGAVEADAARRRALELDPLQTGAIAGLAAAASAAGDHAAAIELYERLRGLGLAPATAARHELALARSLVALGRSEDARGSLRRATLAGGETAAEAHALMAELAEAARDLELAAAALETAIEAYADLAGDEPGAAHRLIARAAALAVARARLCDRIAGEPPGAVEDWARAYELAQLHAPDLARTAARVLLERAGGDPALERRWIDAVLATHPAPLDRAVLLVRRADSRRRGRTPETPAAVADLREALQLAADIPDEVAIETRRRAYQLEAELLAQSGERRARAQALASLAGMAGPRPSYRVEVETAAASAWLAADDAAAALPHATRAADAVTDDVPLGMRRDARIALGEAAWRQRAWPDVIRAYRELAGAGADADLADGLDPTLRATCRHRLAIAAERTGDAALAIAALRPLAEDADAARAVPAELRGQALRLYADLAERGGDLGGAAAAHERFAALAAEGTPTARADASYRAGELFRRADRGEDALRCFEATLRISETHLPALDALEAAWRERGDLERVATILGRKVAATARHPARQKPLLSRLGELQAQLGRPEVALATHQRALEIDPAWRPSLRFVTLRLRDAGQLIAAAGGLAQLAGELPGDAGTDLAEVARERQLAATALAALVGDLDAAQVAAVREIALPALERAALDAAPADPYAAALARLRGNDSATSAPDIALDAAPDHETPGGRRPAGSARSLRDAAARSRAAGRLDEALATLETANHVTPGDATVVRELVDLCVQLGDHAAAARHLTELAGLLTGARRGDTLLELADICYDRLDDAPRGRRAMRDAAEAFGAGARRDAALRLLAAEAATHLAWDVAVEALTAIAPERRQAVDIVALANALRRAGHDADAIALVTEATAAGRFDDGGELLRQLEAEAARKAALAQSLEARARTAPPDDASELRAEARELRHAVGAPPLDRITIEDPDASRTRTKTDRGIGARDKTPAPPEDPFDDEPTIPPGPPARPSPPTLPPPTRTRTNPLGRIKLVSVDARTITERGVPAPIPPAPPVPPPPLSPTSATPIMSDDDDGGWALVTNPRIPPLPPPPPSRGEIVEVFDDDDAPTGPITPLRAAAASTSALGDAEPWPELAAGTLPSARAARPDPIDDELDDEPTPLPAFARTVLAPARDPGSAPHAPATPVAADAPAASAEPGSAPHPIATPRTTGAPATSHEPGSAPHPTPGSGPDPTAQPDPVEEAAREPATAAHAQASAEAAPRRAPTAPVEPASAPHAPASEAAPRRAPTAPVEPASAAATPAPGSTPAGPRSNGAVEHADEEARPSVIISGTPAETAFALAAAAAAADRPQLLAARRANPDDAGLLLALLAHLGDREPALRREVLDDASRRASGRALAIALHELALLAREAREPSRATALWQRAHEADAAYAPVWMMLADTLAAAEDLAAARELYEKVAASPEYDPTRRAFAAERAEALGRDDTIVSGEIAPRAGEPGPRATAEIERARALAAAEDWPAAIAAAERAAAAAPGDTRALELLETLYLETGDVTAASEAIGRQLAAVEDTARRAVLWRRRARLYREALGRDAEAYRCLKEAQACAPADPEIAYQLRVAAIVRGEWALAAQLLYREIAAAANPRDRGALHLELAMIYEERLDDDAQAQVHYEQALAFDPTIPAAKLPLARRYDAIGRYADAARLYEEAAATARAGDRAQLLEAAVRARNAALDGTEPDLPAQLERAEAAGDLDAALELAHQAWRAAPGNAIAFRVLAKVHRASGDLPALTDLTAVRASRAETADERATAWLEVARLAEELDALDQAARAYDLALIEDPGHVAALDARGALAFGLGDYATADLIYRDLAPGESVLGEDELALRRSVIAEQLGRDGEAFAQARAAAAAAPGRRDLLMRVQDLATRGGELALAIAAARAVLDLVPLDDDEALLATQFALVELLRQAGDLEGAVAQLERILRDHPIHTGALEALADLHIARADWPTATRYLYQLVPLAPTAAARAERLYRLGDAVLLHLGDTDRADDVFLRASDLDPAHIPTLRRLLDVYWRADDPGALVEVATELADKGALGRGTTPDTALAHALVAAALVGDTQLAQRLGTALGDDAPRRVAHALAELAGRDGRLQLATASTAVAELARRGLIDLAKIRAAAAGTPVASVLAGA